MEEEEEEGKREERDNEGWKGVNRANQLEGRQGGREREEGGGTTNVERCGRR